MMKLLEWFNKRQLVAKNLSRTFSKDVHQHERSLLICVILEHRLQKPQIIFSSSNNKCRDELLLPPYRLYLPKFVTLVLCEKLPPQALMRMKLLLSVCDEKSYSNTQLVMRKKMREMYQMMWSGRFFKLNLTISTRFLLLENRLFLWQISLKRLI